MCLKLWTRQIFALAQWYGGVASVAPFRMGKRRSSCYDVLDARRLFTLTIVLSCCAVRIELILVKR
jgi:hypothetical protein